MGVRCSQRIVRAICKRVAAGETVVGTVFAILRGYGLDGDDLVDAARALRSALHGFVVLESGGDKPEARTQALYAGTMTLGGPGNDARPLNDYLAASRVRCFGGSGITQPSSQP